MAGAWAGNRRGRGQDKKGRSKREGQYAKMPYNMLESAAWRSLGGPAVKVYFELHRRFWGGNNGELTLSMGEAAGLLGMSKSTAKAALDELEEKGFIVCTKRGHWYRREASTYRLTKERTGREDATRDWQAWRPPRAENS